MSQSFFRNSQGLKFSGNKIGNFIAKTFVGSDRNKEETLSKATKIQMNNLSKRSEISKVIWNCSSFLQETQNQQRVLTNAKNYCN